MAIFGDLNEVRLLGNISSELILKTLDTTTVLNFSMATNRSYKKGEEWVQEATFHNITVWGKDAEYLADKAKVGSRIFLSGRLQVRSWEDQEGKKNYKTEIVSDKVILLNRYKNGEAEGEASKPMSKTGAAINMQIPGANPDELPF